MCVIVYTAQYCTYAAHSVPSTRRELRRSACAELRRDPTLSWGQCPLGAPAEGPTLPGGPVDMCEACCRARREPNKTDADTGDTSTDTDKHGAASGDSSDKEKVKDKEKEKDKGKEKEKMAEGGGGEGQEKEKKKKAGGRGGRIKGGRGTQTGSADVLPISWAG